MSATEKSLGKAVRKPVAPQPPVAQVVPVLPLEGYVRVRQILGDRKANPPIPPVIPVSPSDWWAGVKSGKYPKPVYPFGPNITLWPVDTIRALLQKEVA